MTHAKLSPSSSARWTACTASVEASAGYENKSNSASSWGTACHALGESMLLNHDAPLIGAFSEGVEIDAEMIKTAEEYADYCRALMTKTSVVMIEERFDLSFIAPDTFGTGDFSVLNGTHLDIVDLKTGHGIVMAANNTQLMMYALGAIHELEDLYDIETVTLHIMQSRAGHIDTWETTLFELRKFELFARERADMILSGNTEFNPGAKQCQWCAHQANCDALRSHVDNVVKGGFEDLDDLEGQADKVSTSHIKGILDNADLILGFVKAVQAVALERMEAGETIEGYKLVQSKTNRKWEDEAAVEAYLKKKRTKVDDMYAKKLKPMTQLLKLRKGDKVLESMLIKPEGKPTLAPNSDKREAISAVADGFDCIEE